MPPGKPFAKVHQAQDDNIKKLKLDGLAFVKDAGTAAVRGGLQHIKDHPESEVSQIAVGLERDVKFFSTLIRHVTGYNEEGTAPPAQEPAKAAGTSGAKGPVVIDAEFIEEK